MDNLRTFLLEDPLSKLFLYCGIAAYTTYQETNDTNAAILAGLIAWKAYMSQSNGRPTYSKRVENTEGSTSTQN